MCEETGQLEQIVLSVEDSRVAKFSVPVVPVLGGESELCRLTQEHSSAPFSISEAPLLRISLFRISETDHLMSLVVHHCIADGQSLDVLARDFAELYAAHVGSRRPRLPSLPI
jgi:Condensation domain